MTQEEMNLVINAAINFGLNNDMSGELHEEKQHNLKLLIENHRLQEMEDQLREKIDALETADRNVFMDIKNNTPVDQHLYLCIVDYDPTTILHKNNLRLLFYEEDKHVWKDIDGDTFNYEDVDYFSRIDSDNFVYD